MIIKANLHLHTNDDPRDKVTYSLFEIIDRAAEEGFGALAITCHAVCAWKPEYAEYAASKGIILIRGIEADICEQKGGRTRHVLLLGVNQSAEEIETFADLAVYRKDYPDMLVIAPHPYFDPFMSLQGCAEKYIELFDAIEYSWFYTAWFNKNKKAVQLANKYNKPIVATSDTHFLNHIADHYSLIETAGKTELEILNAIKLGKVTYHSTPHRLFRGLLFPQAIFTFRTIFWRLTKGMTKLLH